MATDTRYLSATDLEPYFVDKQTGEPLSGGKVYFYRDLDRTTLKDVYEIAGSPPNYNFVALPNPITLSGVGTFQDNVGNNLAVYYFPFISTDPNSALDLYYIAVYDQYGNLQFTREAWPSAAYFNGSGGGGGGGSITSGTVNNMISNPTFAEVLFDPTLGMTLNYSGSGSNSILIAPDWTLNYTYTGTGTITVARTSVTGVSAYETNPPYALTVTAGANLTVLNLSQRLFHNPDVWGPTGTSNMNGYVNGSVLLASNSSLTMVYTPSVGAATTIVTAANTSGAYATSGATVQLNPSTNSSTSDSGYVDIVLDLPFASPSPVTFTSIQVVGLDTNITAVPTAQNPVNRQKDQLFHYYNPQLQYKALSSHLVGWNFPLNPTQALGPSISAQAVGANKSYYAWDQTILFQTANSGLTVSRDATGALKVLAAAAGQHALVQYIPAPQAISMLSRRKCVSICANASVATAATVSLWYTKSTLPSTIGSNLALPLTLDANGYPATQNGTWVQVPRSGLSNSSTTPAATNAAQFTIGVAPTGAASFNQYKFNGWDMQGNTDINSATFFAIVVGTASVAHNAYILYQDIACQDGDIATVTGAQSVDEVLRQCQYYYCSSFNPGVVPAQALGAIAGMEFGFEIISGSGGAGLGLEIVFPTKMYQVPVMTSYNPVNSNAQMYDFSNNGDCSSTDFSGIISGNHLNSQYVCHANCVGPSPSSGACIGVGWTADARLGQ